MKAIDRKLWRELWAMRLQALAIAMVIVSGVSIFIMSLSTLDSLYETRESYYRQHHFAEVFAGLKRAPLSLAATKKVMRLAMDHDWETCFNAEAELQQSLVGCADNREGVKAFFEKREPEFKGR